MAGADYHQVHAKIRDQKEAAEGHAVRAMYFYTGAAGVALERGIPPSGRRWRPFGQCDGKAIPHGRRGFSGGTGRFTLD